MQVRTNCIKLIFNFVGDYLDANPNNGIYHNFGVSAENDITGSLPVDIAELKKLKVLDLRK